MEFEFSAGIIIYRYNNNKREYLFLMRSKHSFDLPKGHIEKGEDAITAAIRETSEETNLNVSCIPFFKKEYMFFKTESKKLIKKHVAVFLAQYPDQQIKVSWEHQSYKWLSVENAKKVIFKDMIPLILQTDSYIDKMEKINRINKDYAQLPKKLVPWNLSDKLVAGEGPLDANVMLIGQAPGDYEDKTGRPFVGRSGKLLDHLIALAGQRRHNVYITSTVQFFPPKNRAPTEEEISMCKPFLQDQINIIKPKIIVLLGSIASHELANVGAIMSNHGKIIKKDGNTYFVTLHPAAAVRIRRNLPIIENDFRKLKEIIKLNSA